MTTTNLITQAELIEFSFVSVPANPYALALALEKELGINELVTRGFLNIKEAEPVEVPKVEDPKPEEVIPATQDAEKKFSAKAVMPLVEQLKSVIIALEALSIEEPEREEEPEAETEEEKEFNKYTEHRKTVQLLATMVGEVLAESRQFIDHK